VAPNHSFRHWLIKEAKRAGIDTPSRPVSDLSSRLKTHCPAGD
jgi:hypothetical protein